MSVDIYKKDFQNWLKCVFGLSTIRNALIECISDKLDAAIKQILKQTHTTSFDLKQYLSCLETNKIYRFKATAKGYKSWSCIHSKCQTLMYYFIANHFLGSSLKFKWDRKISSSTAVVEIAKQDSEANSDSKWKIILLYINIENEASVENYTSLNCLDISHVLKLFISCKLISPDSSTKPSEKIFQVLKSRNEIMHSPDNMMTDDDTRDIMKYMMDLLEYLDIAEKTYYKESVQELKSLIEKEFIVRYQSEDCYQIMAKVEKAKDIADDLNASIEDNKQQCKSRSKRLLDVLESISREKSTTDILERKYANYKISAKESLEKKKIALILDQAECDENSRTYKQLENLIKKTEQDIKEVEEAKQKLEPDKMAEEISLLRNEEENLIPKKKKQQEPTRRLEPGEFAEKTAGCSSWCTSNDGQNSKSRQQSKPSNVQLFVPKITAMTNDFSNTIKDWFQDNLFKCILCSGIENLSDESPLFVVCPISSRLEPCINSAIDGIKWKKTFVVLLLYIGLESSLARIPTALKLPHIDKYKNIVFIDVAYTTDEKLYQCQMNEKAKKSIKKFSADFYKK